MIRVDIDQTARTERMSPRIKGDRRLGNSSGAGYEKAHMAADDAIRLANTEVLRNEKQGTRVVFQIGDMAWFGNEGITRREVCSDDGSAYRCKSERQTCEALEERPTGTRNYTQRANGEVELIRGECRANGAMVEASRAQMSANED